VTLFPQESVTTLDEFGTRPKIFTEHFQLLYNDASEVTLDA